jgi:SAM-dependent methyltransferase
MPEFTEVASQARDAARINLGFYDALWSQARLARPERFNTWPLIASLLPGAPARLEVGPGLRPRLPLAGTHFIDISAPVVERLNGKGALAQTGEVGALPYRDGEFDLVCAFDIIEHVHDDRQALQELSRVLKEGAVLILSVPLHAGSWTGFDVLVGHVRRYDPDELTGLLAQSGLVLEKTAVFGMQPGNPMLLDVGIWFLVNRRRVALFWYNWVLLPLGILFQKPLSFSPGLIETSEGAGVDEIVMICRKSYA